MKSTQLSFNELVIAFYLEPLGFEKVVQRSALSNEIGLKGKEIDLYNPKMKIAVEYDGEYAHGDVGKDTAKNNLLNSLGIEIYRFREPKCPQIAGNNYILTDTRHLTKSLERCLKDFIENVLHHDSSRIDFERDQTEIKEYVRMRKRNSLHLFEENIMLNGMKCTIVEMSSCRDITVMFEDGTVVRDKDYSDFKKGNIAHSNETSERKKCRRLFQKRCMNNGHEVTVIECNGWDKLTIEFDNGTIVTNRKYSDFTDGVIGNPNLPPVRNRKNAERMGEVQIMNNGSVGTIVKYRNAGDFDIDAWIGWEEGARCKKNIYKFNIEKGVSIWYNVHGCYIDTKNIKNDGSVK